MALHGWRRGAGPEGTAQDLLPLGVAARVGGQPHQPPSAEAKSESPSHGSKADLFQLASSHAQLASQIEHFITDAAGETDPAIVAYHAALRRVLGLLVEASDALVEATK